jgi:hypothetical protein
VRGKDGFECVEEAVAPCGEVVVSIPTLLIGHASLIGLFIHSCVEVDLSPEERERHQPYGKGLDTAVGERVILCIRAECRTLRIDLLKTRLVLGPSDAPVSSPTILF